MPKLTIPQKKIRDSKKKKPTTKPVKKPEPWMPKSPCLYIDYTTSRTGGSVQSGESSDDPYASRRDEHIEFDIVGVYKSLPKKLFFHHREEVAPAVAVADKVWVVLVRYTTGNTFGTTRGAWHIYSIRSDSRRAEGDKRMIEFDDKLDNMSDHWNYRKLSPFVQQLIAKKKHLIEGYVPWRGYFERLEGVQVLEFDVKS